MGLDMYLTGRKFFWYNRDGERMEDGKRVKTVDVELGYWRKHPNLHGYIVNVFMDGKDECQEIELSADNLKMIIEAVEAKALPETSGFFFGESLGTTAEIDHDLTTLRQAIAWLEGGDADPISDERIDGPGFTALVLKPQLKQKDKAQKVSRSVHYVASW